MSRKFRWFLLASCAFVVLMGGRDTLAVLALGPALQGPSPELKTSEPLAQTRHPKPALLPTRRLGLDGELARSDGLGH